MKSIVRIAGLALFAALGLFFVAFGALYASVTDMLWFHAAAVPEAARPDVLPLYLALMDLIGSASIGLGVLGLYAVFGPLRRGRSGAAYALSIAFSVPLVGAAMVAERLAAMTGSPTSWHIMGGLLAMTAGALYCSTRTGRGPAFLAENRAMEAKSYLAADHGS
jgi:hypothetical protein